MDDDDQFPGEYMGDDLYRISKEDLAEFTIIQAAFPRPDLPGAVAPTIDPVTPDTELKPLDIVMFYDRFSKNAEQDGVNEQAYVVDERRALYQRGIIRTISLKQLRNMPNASIVRIVPEPLAPYVARMLLRYRWRPTMFRFAINFLKCSNYGPFLHGSFFPPDTSYVSDEQYEDAWSHFVSTLEPHDYLLTFDRTSLLSTIIAKGTHGPFSHIASYIGDGKLWEVVTSGTRIVPVETYKGRHYRVAAYRNYGVPFISNEEAMAHFAKTAGRPGYNYVGAFKAGVKTFFGDKYEVATTPNGIILEGPLTLIGQV